MVEKFESHPSVETIEIQKLDLSLFKRRGNSHTYPGYMLQKMKEAREQRNFDVALLIQFFYNKFLEFEEHEKVLLQGWKGKSSLEIINKPDYFVVVTYQKDNQDTEPHQVTTEISKFEVNRIIKVINDLNEGKRISTRDIGEKAYRREWDKIFSDRPLHLSLNLILRILNFYGLTHYRGKYTTVIKNCREIQEVLK